MLAAATTGLPLWAQVAVLALAFALAFVGRRQIIALFRGNGMQVTLETAKDAIEVLQERGKQQADEITGLRLRIAKIEEENAMLRSMVNSDQKVDALAEAIQRNHAVVMAALGGGR